MHEIVSPDTPTYYKNIMGNNNHQTNVVIPGGNGANALGVVRSFGTRNIPVIYIDSEPKAIARHSRYISKRIKCRSLKESDQNFIDILLRIGKNNNEKMVIIPTGDLDAQSISKHMDQLEQFYDIPIPEFNIASTLISKKYFYKFIAERNIDHPKTHIPKGFNELISLKSVMPYPFIVKPSNSILFQEIFSKKCFVIHSKEEFEKAVERLKGKNLDVFIQGIIPGNEIYSIYMYFNKASKPIAICGYDKLRHYPPSFGNGSLCRSKWRSEPIHIASDLLTTIGYQGIAEPEFIKDPRDGKYKLIEINVRTSLQNRLSAGCGLDIEYLAYLDVKGQNIHDLPSPDSGIEWVSDFYDFLSCLRQIKGVDLGIKETLKSLKGDKIHSIAACDDPIPLFIHMLGMLRSKLKTIV